MARWYHAILKIGRWTLLTIVYHRCIWPKVYCSAANDYPVHHQHFGALDLDAGIARPAFLPLCRVSDKV